MRFRIEGRAWDGQQWHLAPALVTLGKQITNASPERRPEDGTVASRNHDKLNPRSDHTVWPRTGGPGTVYALDFGEPPDDPTFVDRVLETIRRSKDPRVKYVIHDRRMFSGYPKGQYAAFQWRPYGGPSPHTTHGHVSVWHGARSDPTYPWSIGVPEQEDLPVEAIKGIQQALIDAGYALDDGADGKWGPETQGAFAQMVRAATDGNRIARNVARDAITNGEEIKVTRT